MMNRTRHELEIYFLFFYQKWQYPLKDDGFNLDYFNLKEVFCEILTLEYQVIKEEMQNFSLDMFMDC
jgi:hypothetical protein